MENLKGITKILISLEVALWSKQFVQSVLMALNEKQLKIEFPSSEVNWVTFLGDVKHINPTYVSATYPLLNNATGFSLALQNEWLKQLRPLWPGQHPENWNNYF